MAADQVGVAGVAGVHGPVHLGRQRGDVLAVFKHRNGKPRVMGLHAVQGLEQLVAFQGDVVGGPVHGEHRGGVAVGVQHRAAVWQPAVELGVQQGLGGGLAVADGGAFHVHHHDVGLFQQAFVAAGTGDRRVVLVEAQRIIAAGGRRPALAVDAAAGGGQGAGRFPVGAGGVGAVTHQDLRFRRDRCSATLAASGERTTPLSVTMAVINEAGVTSNAGL